MQYTRLHIICLCAALQIQLIVGTQVPLNQKTEHIVEQPQWLNLNGLTNKQWVAVMATLYGFKFYNNRGRGEQGNVDSTKPDTYATETSTQNSRNSQQIPGPIHGLNLSGLSKTQSEAVIAMVEILISYNIKSKAEQGNVDSTTTCGMPARSTLNRLAINGERVDRGQLPWIAPLFENTRRSHPIFLCGSTIVSKRHLITAAHCIYESGDFIKPERLIAGPGMYNIHDIFDKNAEISSIQSIHPHEDYIHDDDLNDADIAILRLKTVLKFTEYIIPICLWRDDSDLGQAVGKEGFVAGWGITENGPTNVPTYIKAEIVSQRSCRDNFERMIPQNSRTFCADGRGSAPCNGDSGGGFALKQGNQYYLRGIVSNGRQDGTSLKCDVNKFVMYTDIAPFRLWIRQTMDS